MEQWDGGRVKVEEGMLVVEVVEEMKVAVEGMVVVVKMEVVVVLMGEMMVQMVVVGKEEVL